MSNLYNGLILLEVSEEQLNRVPKISHILKKAKVLNDVWEYIEGSDNPKLTQLIAFRERLTNRNQRSEVPFEAYCVAAGLSTKEALMLLMGEVFDQTNKIAALMAAAAHPEVVNATIDAAVSPLGTAEKKLVLTHTGFLPVAKNSVVHVHGNHAMIATEQKNVILPSVENSVRQLGDRIAENQKAVEAPIIDADQIEE